MYDPSAYYGSPSALSPSWYSTPAGYPAWPVSPIHGVPYGYRSTEAPLGPETVPWGYPDLQQGPETMVTRPPYVEAKHWQARHPSQVILHGSRLSKDVALTFDNGPDAVFTPAILQLLASEGVAATFLCIGSRVRQHPELLRRIAAHGHAIGSHSLNHPDFCKITGAQAQVELSETAILVEETVGVKPTLFRPPYGSLNESVIQTVTECNYQILLWDVDSLDWTGLRGYQMASNVLAHTRPGSIIALHAADCGSHLVDHLQAIRYIIAMLRFQGYEFKTVPDLLQTREGDG